MGVVNDRVQAWASGRIGLCLPLPRGFELGPFALSQQRRVDASLYMKWRAPREIFDSTSGAVANKGSGFALVLSNGGQWGGMGQDPG